MTRDQHPQVAETISELQRVLTALLEAIEKHPAIARDLSRRKGKPATLAKLHIKHHSCAVVLLPAIDRLLTRREREVARLVGRAYGNKGIANSLGISVETVKSHLGNIYQKTGLGSRAELARYAGVALEDQIIPPSS